MLEAMGHKLWQSWGQAIPIVTLFAAFCRFLPLFADSWVESRHSQPNGGEIGIEIPGLGAEIWAKAVMWTWKSGLAAEIDDWPPFCCVFHCKLLLLLLLLLGAAPPRHPEPPPQCSTITTTVTTAISASFPLHPTAFSIFLLLQVYCDSNATCLQNELKNCTSRTVMYSRMKLDDTWCDILNVHVDNV